MSERERGQLGAADEAHLADLRRRMVVEQLGRRGIRDARVLGAMSAVPRHLFVPPALLAEAYDDRPLAIGRGQTISQPYMVARATELADPQASDRVLEVGAGCGYQAAVLARLCREVFAVDIVPELAARARQTVSELGFGNVVLECFDASGGWPEHAPYDVIVVSAGAPRIPPLLVDQLADGGRLVIPVGEGEEQALTRLVRRGTEYETFVDTRCRYVDLLGRYGVTGIVPRA